MKEGLPIGPRLNAEAGSGRNTSKGKGRDWLRGKSWAFEGCVGHRGRMRSTGDGKGNLAINCVRRGGGGTAM